MLIFENESFQLLEVFDSPLLSFFSVQYSELQFSHRMSVYVHKIRSIVGIGVVLLPQRLNEEFSTGIYTVYTVYLFIIPVRFV